MALVPNKYIEELSQKIFQSDFNGSTASLYFSGETMSYIRFNQSRIRQSTSVEQGEAQLTLKFNKKEAHFRWDLRWEINQDLVIAKSFIDSFQLQLKWLDRNDEVHPNEGSLKSFTAKPSQQLPSLEKVGSFLQEVGADLAGLLASGNQWRASLNQQGQSHWFESESHFFDYSLYSKDPTGNNKALKNTYFAKDWDQSHFETQVLGTKHQLSYFQTQSRTIMPRKYRAFLTPAALSELLGILSWGALSYDAYKKGLSPFKKLGDGEILLSPLFNLRENFDLGLQAPFNSIGELAPPKLDLISEGKLTTFLVSSSSSAKYGVKSNFADSSGWGKENLRSPELLPGSLPSSEILSTLGTGLYLGNLHYCNWSDRASARVTGMTRFGCFWIENGIIQAPIQDVRFDISLFDIFGPKGLEALTQETTIIPHTDTYHLRSLGGLSSCGALIKEFACVL